MKKILILLFVCVFIFSAVNSAAVEKKAQKSSKQSKSPQQPKPKPKVTIKKIQIIKVTAPAAGAEWEAGKNHKIVWQPIGLPKDQKYNVLLFSGDKKFHKSTIATNVTGTHKWWKPPYKQFQGRKTFTVRVATTDLKAKGFSKPFDIFTKTITYTKYLKPLIRNRHSKRTQIYAMGDPFVHFRGPTPVKSGSARVGFENQYTDDLSFPGEWAYRGFIYRSRLLFDINQFKGKKGIVLKADLVINVHSSKQKMAGVPGGKLSCARNLYVLTSPWTGKCTSTPGYHYQTLPFPTKKITVDIKELVRDWIFHGKPNHGILLGAIREDFAHNNDYCVSHLTSYLKIEFYEVLK